MPKNLGTYDDDYSVPRKKDVDSKLSLSGGTLTGPLELESNLKFTNATSGNILFSAGGAIRVTQGVLSLEPSNNIIEMSGDSSLNTIVRYVGTPSDDTDAANKAYVDSAVAGAGGGISEEYVKANYLSLSGENIPSVIRFGATGTARTEISATAGAGIVFTRYYANNKIDKTLTFNSNGLFFDSATNGARIGQVGTPKYDTDAATKGYVDKAVAGKVSLSGGTMTGLLTLSGAPTATLHAATKGYVDDLVDAATVDVATNTEIDLLLNALFS